MKLRVYRCAAVTALVAGLVTPVLATLSANPALAAPLVVSDGGDTGLPAQLRQVVNAAAAGDTIKFTVPTVTLTAGVIVINKDLVIRGNGPAFTEITRSAVAPAFGIFEIQSPASVIIDLVTISGGVAPIKPGGAGSSGGGILNGGSLLLTRSTVTNNRASDPNVAIGGGLYNFGSAAVFNTEFLGNSVTVTGDPAQNFNVDAKGGAIFSFQGGLTLANTRLFNNSATSTGHASAGGVYSAGVLTIHDSVISSNTATTTGTAGSASGAGVYADNSLSMSGSAVRSNTLSATGPTSQSVARGAGLYLSLLADSSIDRSEISENQVSAPGLENRGGGLYISANGPITSITNSTIALNSTGAGGFNDGGAIWNTNDQTTLSYTTVAGNTADSAAISAQFGMTLDNSIVANPAASQNCSGVITLTNANATFHPTNNGACVGSITNDPGITTLADNGGINRTYALPSGPAVNAATGLCPATDQRGYTRPAAPACDVGAFELNATLVDTTPPACKVIGVVPGNPVAMDVRAMDTGRGLAAISNSQVSNGSVVVPYFTPRTTQPVILTAVKATQNLPTTWSFTAVDAASPANTRLCT